MLKNRFLLGTLFWGAALLLAVATPAMAAQPTAIRTWQLQARVVAVGLPGVAGVRQIGRFHSGGPIPTNPEFLLSTAPGRVLDPERVMVAIAQQLGGAAGHHFACGRRGSFDRSARQLPARHAGGAEDARGNRRRQ